MLNKIHNMDCREGIVLLPDNIINLCLTSVPYNVNLGDNKYNKNPYNLYNDNMEHKEYINFLKEVFGSLYPKLVSGGRVVINIGDGKNGSVPTHVDISHFMTKDIGYIPMTHIIWEKSQVSNRTSWGSFNSPSSPSFPTPFEHIMVFAKENRKLQHKGITDLNKQEFIDWSLAIWKFAPETRMKKIGHPAMFPLELPKRCIKMFTYVNDTIIDPFNGAGSTCVCAKNLNRNYVGFDISSEYCDIANNRLAECSNG